MARKRMIDPGIWTSEDFGNLSPLAQVYCIGMISNADDEGRLKASAGYLKACIRPYGKEDYSSTTVAIQEIYNSGIALLYDVDGVEYAVLPNWRKYQTIQKPTQSKLPALPEGYSSPTVGLSLNRREEKRSTGDSTSTARTEGEPHEKHPAPIAPNDSQGNTDPVSDLYRAFHTISAREPIPAGKRSEAPAIRQDAEALIARVGLERAKSLIEAKVLEQNTKHDPLSHVGAAIRFVMTDLNGQSETPIENGLEYEPNTHLMHPGLPPNVENAEAYL